MINCSEAVRNLWDYVESNLEKEDQENIDEHLAFCRKCCGEVDFAQELRVVMQEASRPHVPEAVSKRLSRYLDDLEGSPS
jgi:predicted anti-sigma-YlaC factor YlaD